MTSVVRLGCVPAQAVAGQVQAEVTGSVHSWDMSTGVDGPGTRFVVFTAGCPLRCVYCQNPDTWTGRSGQRISATDLLARAARYRRFISAAGGGLTISGGEPLLQPAFTRAILTGAKELGLHTALDTSGYLGYRADDALLDAIDLVLLDIKAYHQAIARRVTGRGTAPTLAFARRLAARHQTVWVRYVLVPGWTDDPGDVAALAEFTASLGNVERVDILPFHKLGAAKYAALGLPYPGLTPAVRCTRPRPGKSTRPGRRSPPQASTRSAEHVYLETGRPSAVLEVLKEYCRDANDEGMCVVSQAKTARIPAQLPAVTVSQMGNGPDQRRFPEFTGEIREVAFERDFVSQPGLV